MTDDEFTSFLVSRGLFAVGSSDTQNDLKQRYGTRRYFEWRDVVDLPPSPLFPEQTERFHIFTDFHEASACLLPPTNFECDFDAERDAVRTYDLALERLTALCGEPEKGLAVNTLSATWKFERMSLQICTFLKEKTTSQSDLFDQYPQLWNICKISIHRNWVRPLTDAEEVMLSSLAPDEMLAGLPLEDFEDPEWRTFWPWERGLLRRMSVRHPPILWKRDGRIGWVAGSWAGIFERSWVDRVRLNRVECWRQQDYSNLELLLKNPFSLEQETVGSVVMKRLGNDALDQLAVKVAVFWELPLLIENSNSD